MALIMSGLALAIVLLMAGVWQEAGEVVAWYFAAASFTLITLVFVLAGFIMNTITDGFVYGGLNLVSAIGCAIYGFLQSPAPVRSSCR
ncbi:MAG: hypothetical protein JWP06_156 [Candidatus Saccharibacteria bacterium]|nr:hypothetical protein [Candidatus Saccharibacteria bacterium]